MVSNGACVLALQLLYLAAHPDQMSACAFYEGAAAAAVVIAVAVALAECLLSPPLLLILCLVPSLHLLFLILSPVHHLLHLFLFRDSVHHLGQGVKADEAACGIN